MPVPALADLPQSDSRAADARPDARQRQLAMLIRAVALAAAVIGAPEALIGLLYDDPRTAVLGLVALGYGTWLAREAGRLAAAGRSRVVARIAMVTLLVIALASALQPTIGPAMAIAALLPAVLTLPFLDASHVRRVLGLAGVVGVWSMLASQILHGSGRIPDHLTSALAFLALVLAFGLLLVFLLEVSRRMKSTADDLRSIVAMSNDLSRTMDPQLVGDRIARHIARAVGANDCALSYWDRPNDRVVTLGYFPLERRSALQPTYSLADYPETRRVLDGGEATIIDTADPEADRHEVAYLRSIGQRSMAIVPLVAAGTTIGTVELTSSRSGAFDAGGVELATMLAGEAAMALENARLYDEIRHQALHDGLTGLANRVLFRDRVVQALERRHGREGRPFAVLFIDLDDFKVLNDTLGHARGDDVLIAAAARVAASLRPSDTAARLGGDEFAVLLDDVGDEHTALAIAIRLADALRQPINLGDASPSIAASIGVALSGGEDETADDLLRNADVAMYAAKASSRGRAEVFRSTFRAEAAARQDLAGQLRGVDQRGELRLDYQPIVELGSGAVVGLEALVRWQPPDRPLLMPGQFIDIAEETGDIVPMGIWILRESCRQTREWQLRLGLPSLQVSVNLSARQFQEPDLVESIGRALEETGLPPSSLILEITESGLMQRTAGTIGRLAELRALGTHLAIDDFGTGYSSLSYLERFPVDILKIDRSFIAGVSATGERPAIARAIVELGRTLGLRVVAEGIEEPDQADWLVSLGCPLGQGYLYSRPLGVDAMEMFLASDATRRVQEGDVVERDVTSAPAPTRQKTSSRRTSRLRLVSGD
ncbi:MAG TPA: bifunctional diguanylate cyclase/phosphodiesterase [Candidatus Limnocylindrales bacterium]|nr:bifunctional diguanylate cyclase/phosphodiesterase [Candidatus Limnocylindrales bacterium]